MFTKYMTQITIRINLIVVFRESQGGGIHEVSGPI